MRRHLPNALTWLRIALAPIVVAGFLLAGEAQASAFHAAAAAAFLLAAALDYVDGVLARALQAQSDFGRMLDPIADKIVAGAGLLVLLVYGAPGFSGAAFLAPATIILGRDAIINGLRADAARRGVDLGPSKLAKVKTALEFMALGALLAAHALPGEPARLGAQEAAFAGYWCLWAAALLSAATGVRYLRKDRRFRFDARGPDEAIAHARLRVARGRRG